MSFNSRAHGGRDLILSPGSMSSTFQFTRPRGARRRQTTIVKITACFNSRAHGGRDSLADLVHTLIHVSIHAPTGGATRGMRHTFRNQCFNSRAHGGRDTRILLVQLLDLVSIHAPTGGATRAARRRDIGRLVSIHAPTGGATYNVIRKLGVGMFQFTRPRGARRADKLSGARCIRFNSRAHGGRDTIPRRRR